MVFPPATEESAMNHLLQQLPERLAKDLSYLGSLCVADQKQPVEVEVRVSTP